jgi:hypothetical protein
MLFNIHIVAFHALVLGVEYETSMGRSIKRVSSGSFFYTSSISNKLGNVVLCKYYGNLNFLFVISRFIIVWVYINKCFTFGKQACKRGELKKQQELWSWCQYWIRVERTRWSAHYVWNRLRLMTSISSPAHVVTRWVYACASMIVSEPV